MKNVWRPTYTLEINLYYYPLPARIAQKYQAHAIPELAYGVYSPYRTPYKPGETLLSITTLQSRLHPAPH